MAVINLDTHRAIKLASEPKTIVDESVWVVARKIPANDPLDRLERDAVLAHFRRFEKEVINILGLMRAIGRQLPTDSALQLNLAETKKFIHALPSK